MGALAEFIAREISDERNRPTPEIETGRAAKVANPAKVSPAPANFSNFSNFSREAITKSAPTEWPKTHRCACGSIGSIGHGWFVRQPEKATWYCGPCFKRLRAEGRA